MVATQSGLRIAGAGLLRCADNDASSGGELCGTYAPKSASGVLEICAWRRLAQPGVDCREISWNSSGSRVPCLSGSQREGDAFSPAGRRKEHRSLLDGVFCHVSDIGGKRFLLCTSAVLLFWCWPDHARSGAGLCTTQRMEFGICGKMVATQSGLRIAGAGLLRCADNDASSGGELCGTYAPKSADGVLGICVWRRLAQPGVDCREISWNSSGSRVPCLSGSQREGDAFSPAGRRKEHRSLLDGVFCHVSDIGGKRFLLCTSAVLLFWCWPDHARPGAGLCTTQRMEFGICGKMVATQSGLRIAGAGLLRCADNDASSGGELCGTYAPKSARRSSGDMRVEKTCVTRS